MTVLDTGRSGVSMLLGGLGQYPNYIAVGSGSQAVTVNTTGLKHETIRHLITGSTDNTQLKKITWTGDFNSIEMSGTLLRELGLFNISSGAKPWHAENFIPITFDGTNELQVQIQWVIV